MSTEHQASLAASAAPLAPEVLEAARQRRATQAQQRAANPPRLPESGHTLVATITAVSIEGDALQVGIVIEGKVQRPEAVATALGQELQLRVPARVEARKTAPRTAAVPLEALDDLREPLRATAAPHRAQGGPGDG